MPPTRASELELTGVRAEPLPVVGSAVLDDVMLALDVAVTEGVPVAGTGLGVRVAVGWGIGVPTEQLEGSIQFGRPPAATMMRSMFEITSPALIVIRLAPDCSSEARTGIAMVRNV